MFWRGSVCTSPVPYGLPTGHPQQQRSHSKEDMECCSCAVILYTMNIGALNVVDVSNGTTNFTNWNQMSDRNLPSVQGAYHGLYTPSRGSSTKTSITRMRPGAGAPGGRGVDVKHNSYARYLARRKATNIRTQTRNIATTPLQGNKTRAYGIVTNSRYCLCFTN